MPTMRQGVFVWMTNPRANIAQPRVAASLKRSDWTYHAHPTLLISLFGTETKLPSPISAALVFRGRMNLRPHGDLFQPAQRLEPAMVNVNS
jgi:hypothetical protein